MKGRFGGAQVRPALTAGSVFLAAAAATMWSLRDPAPAMLERRSSLLSVDSAQVVRVDSHLVQVIGLRASSGLAVALTVKRHVADSVGTYPLAVILGGHRTGKEAVSLLENTRGVIVAAVSYPYDGDPRPYALQFVRDIPKMRRAFVDTPPALMLALDYLLARQDTDHDRVEGIGVSLGAPFMVIAGALDTRISRVWSVHGSGGSFVPLEHNMRNQIRPAPVRFVVAALANALIGGPRLDPERWVGRIAPRQFVMLNARDDARMPETAVRSLFLAAGEPKELIRTSGGHVRSVADAVRPLVDTVMLRIRRPSIGD